MKTYVVSYYLKDFYHTYTIEAENEAKAIQEVLNRMPEGSKEIFREFNIKRVESFWG